MAEAFLTEMCDEEFGAQSAGLDPGELNPIAVQAMSEARIDISSKKTQAVEGLGRTLSRHVCAFEIGNSRAIQHAA